jgi:hypothetical protein
MENKGHKMQLNPLNIKANTLAESLHVLRGKAFRVRVTSNKKCVLARLNGLKEYLERNTFMIGEQLCVKGEYDGWSQWYGVGNSVSYHLEEFQNWINEGLITLNIYQTKTSSICPQYIELLKKKNLWK